MTIENVLLVSAALFALGAYGAVSRSSLITFSRFTPSAALLSGDPVTAEAIRSALTGHAFAIFVIAVAAGEAALAFALVFAMFRARESIEITDASVMKN